MKLSGHSSVHHHSHRYGNAADQKVSHSQTDDKTEVCQPAALACEKLLQPVDKAPDLTGNWRVIAMSSEICLWSLLMRYVFWPSVEVDITSTETPNTFIDNYKGKVVGTCFNASGDGFVYGNSTSTGLFATDRPFDEPVVLLQSGCPDCVVLKQSAACILLFSRRKTVSAEEMKVFETQAECLGWAKPQLFNSDYVSERIEFKIPSTS
ncbi:hypothetical protein CgunFtcFv8_014115 [Champsocephalus gunnari]|uniref:Apolipoprotein M n=1 Tax=Champsocephalus gunnari TaxID=52237 RepID=A0AAN8HZK4_CHAGU|nr:hypothetical protein CgunFtcFv8_014115 [Champsocephalus gunnari]